MRHGQRQDKDPRALPCLYLYLHLPYCQYRRASLELKSQFEVRQAGNTCEFHNIYSASLQEPNPSRRNVRRKRRYCIMYPSIYSSIHPSIHINQPVHPFIHELIYPLFIHPSIHLYTHLYINSFICPFIRPYIHLSVHLSIQCLQVTQTQRRYLETNTIIVQ